MTIEILSKDIVDGLLTIVVQFTQGSIVVTKEFKTDTGKSETFLNDVILQTKNDLIGVYQYQQTIPLGVFTPIEDDPPTPDPDRDAYLLKLNKYKKFDRAVELNIIPNTNQTYVDLKQWLIDNFQPAYGDMY